MNHDLKVRGLDFDTPEFLEWKPEDPLDCDVWATVSIGDERGSVLFQLHICTAASMKRIENKRHCFVIEQFAGKEDLIARLDSFIAEKTKGCTGDPCSVLAELWRYEYGKYDRRGNLIGTSSLERTRAEHVACGFQRCGRPASLSFGVRPSIYMTTKHRIFTTSVASVYPLYVAKVEKKGRKKSEVDAVICWLTGYNQRELERQLKKQTDFETFFKEAPRLNPSRTLIKGVICGVRVEEIQEPTMREIRYLDKLVDELAKGKAMEKILRA